MPSLSTYNHLDEIKDNFDLDFIINSEKELQDFIDSHSSHEEYIYRGVKDASWKIFSSSQRDYLVNGMNIKFGGYNNYLNSLYQTSKTINKNLLENFYKITRQNLRFYPINQQSYYEEKIPYNNYWVFSFLQHYGTPTPLIDFSGDFNTSLFFAWDGASKVIGSYNLSDYLQINYFNRDIKDSNFKSMMLYCKDKTLASNPANSTDALNEFTQHFDFFNSPKDKGIYYLDRSRFTQSLYRVPSQVGIDIEFSVINLNIIAQNGLFLINFKEDVSLEEQWNSLNIPKIKKTLIHKSLLKYIEDYLISSSGNNFKNFFYPMEEELAKDIYQMTVK